MTAGLDDLTTHGWAAVEAAADPRRDLLLSMGHGYFVSTTDLRFLKVDGEDVKRVWIDLGLIESIRDVDPRRMPRTGEGVTFRVTAAGTKALTARRAAGHVEVPLTVAPVVGGWLGRLFAGNDVPRLAR